MKRFAVLILLLCAFLQSIPAGANDQPGEDSLYINFNPTFLLPRNGTARPLYGVTYSLLITKDSVVADLPYQGRAWSVVNVNPQYQGIRFVSRRFTIRKKDRKRGMQFITVELKDAGDVYRITLSIPRTGESTVQVFSDRRDMVGFTGETPRPPEGGDRRD